MQSVSSTIGKKTFTGLFCIFCFFVAQSQENSPFSRYGLGDLLNGNHAIIRSMGGISAAQPDGNHLNVGQFINFNNPSLYGNLKLTSFDLGLTIDSRTLKSTNPSGKFVSNNFFPSYMAIGMPLNKKRKIGLAFGLKPVTKINYSVITRTKVGIDSVGTEYEGTGGLNQFFIGIGKAWKNLNIGINSGYNFGRKEINTRKTFINDTTFFYQSNASNNTAFGGIHLSAAAQYEFSVAKKNNPEKNTTANYLIRLGSIVGFSQKLSAIQSITKNTYIQSQSGDIIIDSVFAINDIKGKIEMPASVSYGITLHKTLNTNQGLFEMWSIGAEYTSMQWSKFRFMNTAESLINSWQFKLGVQFLPTASPGRNYWNSVNYRFGFFTGEDFVNVDGKKLKQVGFSLGAGFPIKKWSNYDYQFTTLNTAIQFGKRGSGVNNITENYFQLTFGISLSDIWFIKRRYD